MICIKKSHLIFLLFVVVGVLSFFLGSNTNKSKLTFNSKAAGQNLKSYLRIEKQVIDSRGSYTYPLVYNGLTDTTNKVTLLPQQRYNVCILSTSPDESVTNMMYSPYGGVPATDKYFSLTAKGTNLLTRGAYDGFTGCWGFTYNSSGTNQIYGIFSPVINGRQVVLSTPVLSVTVQ